jgi:outer membrane autotransporter protein
LVTPIQSGTVIVDVVAGVAQDVAGNSNTAAEAVSTEYIDENFVRERTKRIINNFVARRADQITLNDPNLAGRLLSDGTGGRLGGQADHKQTNLGFNGKASGEDARLDKIIGADAAEKVNFWTRASLVSVNAEDAKNDMFLVYAGVDYKLNDDTIVGVMAQYDFAEEKNDTEAYEVSGKGWMVGPYIVSRVTDKLIYDGRAAWGLSTNDISPFKTYTDEFKTNRWLLKSQFTGDFRVNDWNVNPNLAVIYFQEDVDGYRDSLGIDISDQKVSLGRVTFGPRVSKTFETNTKTTLTPTLSVRGIWDFEQADIVNLDTGLATATGAFRARTEAGLAIGLPGGASLTLDSFYDGIGQDDYEAYGGLFGISFPLK